MVENSRLSELLRGRILVERAAIRRLEFLAAECDKATAYETELAKGLELEIYDRLGIRAQYDFKTQRNVTKTNEVMHGTR